MAQHGGTTGRALAHKKHVTTGTYLGIDQQFQATVGAIKDQIVTAGGTGGIVFAGSCATVGTVGLAAGGTKAIHQDHYGVAGGAESAAERHFFGPIQNRARHVSWNFFLDLILILILVEQSATMRADRGSGVEFLVAFGAKQCKFSPTERAEELVRGQSSATFRAQVLAAGGTVIRTRFQVVVAAGAFHDTLLGLYG